VAVFTGASTRAARILLRAANLDVDIVLGGDQVERPKPAADGMLLAAQRLATAPDHLIMIGDSPLDLQAAKAAGSYNASAAWGHMYDPSEPADVTLTTPQELLHLLG
jgi:phosphoglycolate phosphatase